MFCLFFLWHLEGHTTHTPPETHAHIYLKIEFAYLNKIWREKKNWSGALVMNIIKQNWKREISLFEKFGFVRKSSNQHSAPILLG